MTRGTGRAKCPGVDAVDLPCRTPTPIVPKLNSGNRDEVPF
jgi:hypothetical protein